jgi:hypothetical protein
VPGVGRAGMPTHTLGTEQTMKKIAGIIAVIFVLFVIAQSPQTVTALVSWVATTMGDVFNGLLEIFQSL